jgi:hypothetical protein
VNIFSYFLVKSEFKSIGKSSLMFISARRLELKSKLEAIKIQKTKVNFQVEKEKSDNK